MGGVWVTPEVKKLLIDVWMSLKAKTGTEPSAKDVLVAAQRYLKAHGDRNTTLPRLRKTQEIISEARRSAGDLSKAETALDETWTVSSMPKHTLPNESIPKVIATWKYAVCCHEPFTVRQAKWVSRIHHFFENITLLWFWSREYARRELLSVISGTPNDTDVPDLNVFFSVWENATLRVTDYRKGKLSKYKGDRFLVKTDDGEIIEELLHGVTRWADRYLLDEFDEREGALARMIEALPSLSSLGMVYESKLVYLRWFTYLTKGPKWAELPADEALAVIKTLREWVLSEQEHVIYNKPRPTKQIPGLEGFTVDHKGGFEMFEGLLSTGPFELLKIVGHWKNEEEI